uniref:AN1-type domain-containing protein n=1 Tax=Kalanchoe fedtschenkoi TaxID=63787 RepID=A0A7N0TN64_KALFE
MAFGGTEAFPELGRHCQRPDCRQLDFLPFKCHACLKVFCLEHRVQESHNCPKAGHDSRKVVVCDVCSTSIETTGRAGQDEKEILTQHARSGKCDPKLKKKPTCGVRRCKEILTFSNCSTCKTCQMKVCLKHRFPADHACQGVKAKPAAATAVGNASRVNDKFLMALAQRNCKDCGMSGSAAARVSPPSTSRSTKAH